MARTNGGIIGKRNASSFGKCTVTSKTSTGAVTTQPGTRVMDVLVVGAGGGGGATRGGGGGAGGFRSFSSLNVCGNSPYTATINGGGAGGTTPSRTGTAGGLSKIVIDVVIPKSITP